MHSHSVNAVLATLLDGGSEFRVTNLEMIKVRGDPHGMGWATGCPISCAAIWGPALAREHSVLAGNSGPRLLRRLLHPHHRKHRQGV